MAEKGAPGLSLREVAREMGLVSSALYRYFATRDELLTALIVDAYNDLGEFAERAAAARTAQRTASSTARRRRRPSASGPRPIPTSTPCSTARRFPVTKRRPFTVEPAARVALVLGFDRGRGVAPAGTSGATTTRQRCGVLETRAWTRSCPACRRPCVRAR